uniref:Ribonuclease kappa n=1 Tax=Mesocestoides corti TaxID=53468 RepID=A0A5K3EV62_MESCO
MAPLIGMKCSACLLILGVWGVIMLVLMGILTRVNAVAFVEDVPIDMAEWEKVHFESSYVDEKYAMVSTNCFTAAGLYLIVLIFAASQFHLNRRQGRVSL